jgi:hypothetical protein
VGERAFAFLQGSLETSKGSNIAATRVLLARLTNPNFNQPREFIEEDRGTLVAAGRFVAGVKDYTFTIEGPANYEQLGWFLQTAIRGSVAASTVGSTGKRYIFSPNTTTTGDDLQAASFEFGDDTQGYLMRYCEATGWELGFDTLTTGQAAPVNMSLNYVTQSLSSNTKTSGLTAPSVNSILGTGGTFAIGSTSTGFGSLSTLTGSLRAFKVMGANNLGRKVFVGDGVTYSNVGRGRRVITFEATFEGDSNGVTRFVEWDLATEKRMRLQLNGPTIAGSSPATAYQLWIDGRVLFTTFDPIGEVDTNTVYRTTGRFLEDASHNTTNSDITVTLTNLEATYT